MKPITTSTAKQRMQQLSWRLWTAVLETVLTYLPPSISESSSSSLTALDIGSGTAEVTALMQQLNPTWNVWGFDQDPEMLACARCNHPTCQFGCTSISSGNLTLVSLGLSEPANLI
jgi:methylase of polypeptide subunit release factors